MRLKYVETRYFASYFYSRRKVLRLYNYFAKYRVSTLNL